MSSNARVDDWQRCRPAWWQSAVIVAIVSAVGFSFGLNVINPGGQLKLPERLGTLELIGAIEGEEAVSRVEDLHGIAIELTGAYVVEYVHGRQRGSVWVGLTDNSAIAEALAARMRVAIDDDGSAFSNVRQTLVTGRPVYRVDGPGEDHFFYHSERYGRQAVWLTISVSNPLDVLEETVKYY